MCASYLEVNPVRMVDGKPKSRSLKTGERRFVALMPRDASRFVCPRPRCPDRGKPNRGHIRFHAHYGSGSWARLKCTTCGHTFTERRANLWYPLRLPLEKVAGVLRAVARRRSVHETARMVGVNKNTVLNVVRAAEQRSRRLQLALVRDLRLSRREASQVGYFIRHRERLKRKNRFA